MKKHPFRRTGAYALLSLGTLAGLAVAYSYTWIGGSSGSWSGENWTRAGCGSPCEEYPDDAGDDAVICGSVQVDVDNYSIDDLYVCDGNVRIGKATGGYCQSYGTITVDSVTISAGSTATAQLSGGNCEDLTTN